MPQSNIERVAIIGVSGHVGKSFAEALVETGKHEVTAIVRPETKGSLPAGVKSAAVDYANEASIIEALKGQQFLIITLAVRAPQDLHERIVKAAAAAGVKWIMPNVYGGDYKNEQFGKDAMYGTQSLAKLKQVEDHGMSYVALCCGFWYEWSLALPEQWFGFEIKDRKVTFFDDGNAKISVSTWDQCGRAIAGLLSLPETGATPALVNWKNAPLYIASFKVSQRDMLDSLHRVLGTTDEDWSISHEPTAERYQRGLDEMKAGVWQGYARAMYTRTFYPNGDGDFHHRGLANEQLGLPQESLDEATKRTVGMVESGWNPFA